MATKKTESEKKFKHEIPEEAREHYKKARQEMREAIKGFLPEGFLEHRSTARKEMMLAVRSMLDAAIKKIDEKA
jgi:transketolase